ncbi:MAG: carboxypeptidase-like regulatory domain-containing protein [Gemmatimonadota bacterium]|nr:carboxypeptidase-like regulatory domain-containing protein [Gemmatimonadota bacterium]
MTYRRLFLGCAAFAAVCGLGACADAGSVTLLDIDATGAVYGLAFLDLNGTGALDGGDEPLPSVGVALTSPVGGAVLHEAVTDADGVFVLDDVPAGTYRLGVLPATLGDTLEALPSAGAGTLTVQRGDTLQINPGVTFPVLTIEEARSHPVGRRIFTSGIALNARLNYGDGLVHLKGDSLYLRGVDVPRSAITFGDSIRFLGRTAVDNGQPVLTSVTPFELVSQAALPAAVDVTTAQAASARGGPLDAALVRIQHAAIVDTATVNGDYVVTVDDGSGPVELYLRSFLQIGTDLLRPGIGVGIQRSFGLLVPVDDGSGTRWRLLPRGAGDMALEAAP